MKNKSVGRECGKCAKVNGLSNCTFIGFEAGMDIIEGDGIVIIGDGIKDLDRQQEDVMFIGDKVAIGRTINGKPINLREVIEDFAKDIGLLK